jgi:hypothetical protein
MRVAWTVTAGLLVVVVGAMRAATRLDRLEARTDAAWAALDAALCHRAHTVSGLGTGVAARCAADAALRVGTSAARAGAADREKCENELGRMLALLNRSELEAACARQLVDAEQRVVIARRVYNDAVRDTQALRSHRMVRWLRLAGRAPLPCYFEIAEPALTGYGLELDGVGA